MNNDLISRQAILGKIRDYIEEYSDLEPNGEHNLKWCAMREAEEVVLTEPPAQAEQRTEKRTGHWFDVGSLSCRCSECGGKSNRESRYCPNCGAKNGDGGVDMDRHLDGIYLRIERNGKFQAVCLSDMTREELETNLDPSRGEWLKDAVIHLARTLSDIGEMLDLEAKIDDE